MSHSIWYCHVVSAMADTEDTFKVSFQERLIHPQMSARTHMGKAEFSEVEDPAWKELRTHEILGSELWSIVKPSRWTEEMKNNMNEKDIPKACVDG